LHFYPFTHLKIARHALRMITVPTCAWCGRYSLRGHILVEALGILIWATIWWSGMYPNPAVPS